MSDRAAILIHCSSAEALEIRKRASLEHRTTSSYMAYVLMGFVAVEERLFASLNRFGELTEITSPRPLRPRTTILLRCSLDESARIRRAAKRRKETWNVQ